MGSAIEIDSEKGSANQFINHVILLITYKPQHWVFEKDLRYFSCMYLLHSFMESLYIPRILYTRIPTFSGVSLRVMAMVGPTTG